MIPLEPVSLESKLFFLTAAEFGGRLFRGPQGPDDADWLELVLQGPAELANMLPDHRPAAEGDPDFAIPTLLARLTGMDDAAKARDLRREALRLTANGDGRTPSALLDRLAHALETLTALLAGGWLGQDPDKAARAGTLCRDILAPDLDDLSRQLADTDRTGVLAAATAVMLAVVRAIGRAA